MELLYLKHLESLWWFRWDFFHILRGNHFTFVIEMFDGNWLEKKKSEIEEENFARLLMDRDKQKLEDFIEDLQYEADIDESYEKLQKT